MLFSFGTASQLVASILGALCASSIFITAAVGPAAQFI